MNKKSQGLSINVIIIVAIGLIILVVLIAIFTGRLGSFVGGVESTTTCSNSCEALNRIGNPSTPDACTGRGGRILQGSYSDVVDENDKCCCFPK